MEIIRMDDVKLLKTTVELLPKSYSNTNTLQ